MSENFRITRVVAETGDGRAIQLLGTGVLRKINTSKRPDDLVPSQKKELEPFSYWTMEFSPSLDRWYRSLDELHSDDLPPSQNAPGES